MGHGSAFSVVFQLVSTENAYSGQMNPFTLFLEYFKVSIKNSGDFSHYISSKNYAI